MGLDVLVFLGDLEGEVGLGEFFLGHGGELVESLLVGLVVSGVVSLNLGEVLKEDTFSVGVLELRGILDTVSGFPGLELGDLGALLLAEEEGCSADEGDEDGKLLSVHDLIMKSVLPELHLSYHSRIIDLNRIFHLQNKLAKRELTSSHHNNTRTPRKASPFPSLFPRSFLKSGKNGKCRICLSKVRRPSHRSIRQSEDSTLY